VGLGIFDFCMYSRRLISKDSMSSQYFSFCCSYAERALWCRDSKRQALGKYFPVRIYYEFFFVKIISCLCAHDVRTVDQRSCGLCVTLEVLQKTQVGVFKRRVFRQCHFPIRHHELFLLRSRSDFHDGNRYKYVANVANFWEHSRIRSSWFNHIHLHCSKINQSDTYR